MSSGAGALSSLAIRRPVATVMAFLGLAICGVLAWRGLPVELLPRFQPPMLWVIAVLPGASPDAMEQDVLRRAEGEIATLEGVDEISSRVETGQAFITVKLDRDADVELASLRVQQRMAALQPQLSDQARLFVQRFDTSMLSTNVMTLSLRGSEDLEALRHEAEERVVPLLQAVPGVVDVSMLGGARKQVAVIVDPERARARGTSALEVRQALVAASMPETSVGTAVDASSRLPIVLDGRARRVTDVADAPVAGTARVKDVAEIQLGIAGSVERYRIGGQAAVRLVVSKDPQANMLRVAKGLRAAVAEYERDVAGPGRALHVDDDASKELEKQLDELRRRALSGALLALLVLLVFLRDVRGVAVVGLAIPATLLVGADLFAAAGLTVNVLSLLGLAVSVGLLLDNSIVVLEAITRRVEKGDDPVTASERGVALVRRAVLAGTATTLVVFLPLFLVQTDASPLFRELALSVMLPLTASLLVALTLLPMIAARLGARLRAEDVVRWPGEAGLPRPGWARSIYSAVLRAALRAPAVTCAVVLAAVVATLVFGGGAVLVFAEAPREPQQSMAIRAELPAGSSIEASEALAVQVEELARAMPQVREMRSTITEETTDVVVDFVERAERTGPLDVAREREALRLKLKQLEASSKAVIRVDPPPDENQDLGSGGAFGLSDGRETVRVKGPAGPALRDLADRVRDALEQAPGVTAVRWDVGTARPTLEIVPDRERLARAGLPPSTLLGILWTTRREGERLPEGLRMGDEEIDLALHVEGADRRTIADVAQFPLVTPQGELLPLSSVASVRTGAEPPIARRHERERAITLSYAFDERARDSNDALEATRRQVDRALAGVPRPLGHAIEVTHADTEGLDTLQKMVFLGLALVFAVLAMAFESATLPFLVLLAAPLAAVGVIGSLALTSSGLNEMVVLALVVLLGLVVNQGILFIDRSEALVAGGSRRPAAILRAAHERLRPILMTTTATAVGLLPLAIDKGGEQEIWPPFARALLGGLVSGTLISLVFIPAAALLFGRLRDTLRELGSTWTAVTTLLTFGLLAVVYWPAGLVTNVALRALFVLPAWVVAVALARAALGIARGERPPDLVTGRPLVVRVRRARKVYGGDPRPVREARRVQRWDAIARKLGLDAGALRPRAELWRQATWQAGAIGLLAWVAMQARTTWGLALLSVPILLVAHATLRTAAALVRRPTAWPVRGVASRFVPLLVGGATWLVLFLRRRDENPYDVASLVLAAIGYGAWALARLVKEGGLGGVVARIVAPAPKTALAGVTLRIEPGLIGLLGPNGAGKSTLMRLVVNLYEPTRGCVTVNDHDVSRHAASLQPAIGFLPQFFGVPPRMTARRYLAHQALVTGMTDPTERARRVEEVLSQVGLADRGDELMGGFSGGMRQRVGIARTLLNAPRIVVVDEPTVGLDPRERIRFRNLLADLAKERIVVLSTHVVEDIGSACREVVVLDQGLIVFRGAPAELSERARGLAWIAEIAEGELAALQRSHRVVSTTPLPGARVAVRGVGPLPEGATPVDPTLEDAYLLLLGRARRELPDVA